VDRPPTTHCMQVQWGRFERGQVHRLPDGASPVHGAGFSPDTKAMTRGLEVHAAELPPALGEPWAAFHLSRAGCSQPAQHLSGDAAATGVLHYATRRCLTCSRQGMPETELRVPVQGQVYTP
jgi:hypothetical protein